MQLIGKPLGLAPEDQDYIIGRSQRRVPERLRCPGRKEEWVAQRRQVALERVPARPQAQVHILPVVEASALDLTLFERKAKWLDQVQYRARGEAGSAGVSGVPVNLGMHEHDVGF